MLRFLRAAAQRHTRAMYELAKLYKKGKGIQQNLSKAVYFYKQAFHSWHRIPKAAFDLGRLCEYGLGVAQDYEKAVFYYGESMTHIEIASYKLGCFYQVGLGVVQDFNKAGDYYTQAITHAIKYTNHEYAYRSARALDLLVREHGLNISSEIACTKDLVLSTKDKEFVN